MTGEQLKDLENRLWQAADKLRADSGLKANEYATPILGLIFLRFASIRFNRIKPEIDAALEAQRGSRMQQSEVEIAIAKCGFYLPEEAQYDYLLNLPEEADIAKAIKEAMEQIEKYKKAFPWLNVKNPTLSDRIVAYKSGLARDVVNR